MANNNDTLDILIETVKEAWQQIYLSISERLSESMPRRVQAIIDSNGWYTKY
jgi:hypothetical protein